MSKETLRPNSIAKLNLLLSIIIIVSAEIISWSGIMPPAHEEWQSAISSYFSGRFGFLSAAAACFSIITWRLPVIRLYRLLILTAGAAFGLLLCAQASSSDTVNCLMAGWGTISLISTLIYLLIANADNDDYFRIKDYFMEVLAIVLFIMASSFYLKLTVALHHETYDLKMLIWDNLMFGALPSAYINLQSNSTPGMMGLLKISYIFLPIFMISMRFMDAGKRIPINITGIFLGTAALGYCIYFIAPVCGPVYLLGERFPLDIPDLADVAGHATMPLAWPDFPRNGIPSLHMAWALSLALISVYLGTAARVWAGMALALTFCATLALGEHYVIDLIIAVPFSVFIQTLFTAVPEKRKPRRVALIIFSALITAVSILVALIPGYDLIASGPFWLAFWSVIMLMSLTVFHLLHKDAIN